MEISSREFRRAKKEPFTSKDLTPIEHIFIGSTVIVDGVRLKINTLGSYLEKNKADPWGKLLTPLSILSSSREGSEGTREEVNSRRLQEKRLAGTMIVFDLAQLVELERQGKKLYLELPALSGSGRTKPFFGVGLVDENGKEIDASQLRINPKFSQHFALGRDLDSKQMLLRVKF